MVNISVIGRLVNDAEITSGKNSQYVKFRLAADDLANNEKVTSWFGVRLFGDRHIKLAEYLKKGSQVFITGSETVGTYQSTKDGSTLVSRDILAHHIEFVSSGGTKSEGEQLTTGTFKKVEMETIVPDTKVDAPLPPTGSNDVIDDLPF